MPPSEFHLHQPALGVSHLIILVVFGGDEKAISRLNIGPVEKVFNARIR